MTWLCDIELYKELLEQDQIEIEEIDSFFNETLDIIMKIDEDTLEDNDILFPQ